MFFSGLLRYQSLGKRGSSSPSAPHAALIVRTESAPRSDATKQRAIPQREATEAEKLHASVRGRPRVRARAARRGMHVLRVRDDGLS